MPASPDIRIPDGRVKQRNSFCSAPKKRMLCTPKHTRQKNASQSCKNHVRNQSWVDDCGFRCAWRYSIFSMFANCSRDYLFLSFLHFFGHYFSLASFPYKCQCPSKVRASSLLAAGCQDETKKSAIKRLWNEAHLLITVWYDVTKIINFEVKKYTANATMRHAQFSQFHCKFVDGCKI